MPEGTFARAVEDLVKCGYIVEYKRGYTKGNPTFLQLTDSFLLFHYHFMAKENRFESYGELTGNEGMFSNWRGQAFELMCFRHILQLKKALGISGVKTKEFSWVSQGKDNGAQIDLVIERDDGITNLCEMKCTDKPFAITKDYELNLLNKRDTYKAETNAKQALRIVLVSADGMAGVAHT